MNPLNEFLRKHFAKDKKSFALLAAVLCIGLILLLWGNFFPDKKSGGAADTGLVTQSIGTSSNLSYEEKTEKRLEEIFSKVDGVGNVKVMISLSSGRELIVGEDTDRQDSSSSETDSQGGTRETTTSNVKDSTILITDRNGESKPLVLKEVEPKIEGVIIIAEGGDSIFVKDALIKAASAVLGVECYKVSVLKMK